MLCSFFLPLVALSALAAQRLLLLNCEWRHSRDWRAGRRRARANREANEYVRICEAHGRTAKGHSGDVEA
jgi:hypothetical protein